MVFLSNAALEAFFAEEDGDSIVMLNLIRFAPDGGLERYKKYHRMAKPILARFGAKVVFGGDGLSVLTSGQEKAWDAVVLVHYPSRSAFRAMIADTEYQGAFAVGVSAIADIVLQPLKSVDLTAA